MAVRSTMLSLINKIRGLIGDPDTGSAQFTTEQIQDELDNCRLDIFNEFLRPVFTYVNGAMTYTDHFSRYGYWEDGETLLNNGLQVISATAREPLLQEAHWNFVAGQFPPIRATGKAYDIWRCSANLLERWIAATAQNTYDFSGHGKSFSRGQVQDNRWKLVLEYRMKQRPGGITMFRGDAANAVDQQRMAKVGPVSAGVPFITGP